LAARFPGPVAAVSYFSIVPQPEKIMFAIA